MSACPRCATRGKTWEGSDPQCAFEATGSFVDDNWNCATMNALREKAKVVYNEDQRAALLPILSQGDYVVLGWYKNRGHTERCFYLSNGDPVTLEHCEEALR